MPPRKAKPGSGFTERRAPYGARGAGVRRVPFIPDKKLPGPETLPDGTVRYFLTLGAKGRVLLPAEMRGAMGLGEGDVIIAWLKDGEVCMHSHLQGLRMIQDAARAMVSDGAYASEELIAERRTEVAKEEEEDLLSLRDARKRRR
jgi:bifunctional DNA-binding transcriptional regulator/antitoxin component of YhaV-PrlF toxin-antitoxin module